MQPVAANYTWITRECVGVWHGVGYLLGESCLLATGAVTTGIVARFSDWTDDKQSVWVS